MSVSKSSDEREYANFLAFISASASARLKAAVPSWNQVKDWRGKMVAEMDYETFDGECGAPGATALPWNEGYRYWWKLFNVKLLDRPFPVRGNVGMWVVGT